MNKVLSQAIKKAVSEFSPTTQDNHLDKRPDLFSLNNENLTTNFIKDNVIEYRELSESAFKRSFERDKALLKDMGFLLDFENDKWKINDGYKLSGTQIFDDIKNN